MNYIDNRPFKEKLGDQCGELIDDISNEVIDSKSLTIEEAADIFVAQLKEWKDYYRQRFEFYERFQEELGKRIC